MSQDDSLEVLLEAIQVEDEAALCELHRRYVNLVYSVAYRVLDDGMAAEEVTQDTFLRVWQKAALYDPDKGEFVTWLLTITRRLAIDTLRKRQRRRPSQPMLFIDENPDLWETQLSSGTSELRRSLLAVLHELPPEQQDAIGLAYFYGMSHSDIAAYRDIPLGTVKTRIRQGMKKLRTIWLSDATVHPKQDSLT